MMDFPKVIDRLRQDPSPYLLFTFILTGFGLYLNTFGSAWTYDDYFVILQNPDIMTLKGFVKDSYPGRPMRELTFMLDYKLFGFAPSAWHVQNVIWHALNAWLVFCLSNLLLKSTRVAWLAASLFLVHPVQVEVVAQMSHRKDSLALFFMLLSFVLYLLSRRDGKPHYLLGALIAMILAFLSKENSYVLPAFMILYEVCWGRRSWKKINGKSIVLLLLVAFVFIPSVVDWNSYSEKANALLVSNNYFAGFNPTVYLLALLNAWGFIFLKLIWPFNLAVNYVLEVPGSWLEARVLFSLLSCAAYLVCLVLLARKNAYLFAALLWMGILYLPTANLVPVNHFAADRYLYAPSVGFCMAAAYLLDRLVSERLFVPLAVVLLVGLSGLTVKQSTVWQDNETLWTHSLRVNPNSARAVSNSGLLLYSDDDQRNLEMQLRAEAINPYDPFIQVKLGEIYERKGMPELARKYFAKGCSLFNPHVHGMYKKIFTDLEVKNPGLQCLD